MVQGGYVVFLVVCADLLVVFLYDESLKIYENLRQLLGVSPSSNFEVHLANQ